MKRIGITLYNWRELWLWPFIAFLQIEILVAIAFLQTGHKPQESADWLVVLGWNVFKCTLAISLVSVFKESAGRWWTADELKANAHLVWSATLTKAVALVAFLWALSR